MIFVGFMPEPEQIRFWLADWRIFATGAGVNTFPSISDFSKPLSTFKKFLSHKKNSILKGEKKKKEILNGTKKNKNRKELTSQKRNKQRLCRRG